MIVVLELDGVVVDLTAERPVKLLGARLLAEYRGAGFSYALTASHGADEVEQVLRALGVPQVPVLGSGGSPRQQWSEIVKPGVFVSGSRSHAPEQWGRVQFDRTWRYPVLVQKLWNAVPSSPEEAVS